jgi:succinyl-CoA:acetate CoA-transferase
VDDISERIRHRESRDKVMTAAEAALLFRDGMLVATSGSTMGYPKSTFMALSERIKKQGGIKIDLVSLEARNSGRRSIAKR